MTICIRKASRGEAARAAALAIRMWEDITLEDLTDEWKEYYLEALWKEDNVCLPQGKKFSYVLFICERV